jgi:hypothetical protein
MAQGWEQEKERHSLARKGVRTLRRGLTAIKHIPNAPGYISKSTALVVGTSPQAEASKLAQKYNLTREGGEEMVRVFVRHGIYDISKDKGYSYIEPGANFKQFTYAKRVPPGMNEEVREIRQQYKR